MSQRQSSGLETSYQHIERYLRSNSLQKMVSCLSFPFLSDRYDSEEPKYDYKNPGFSREAGHFTQVRN